jgi:SAM-dependent methyltransferase
VGDTTFLAADLVGPNGFVVGVDRSADAISTARQRAEAAGRLNVQFVQGELGAPIAHQDLFDAIVGRLVLVHQPDIVAALRGLRGLARQGGLLAFHEIDFEFKGLTDPSSDLVETVLGWIHEACRLGGIQLNAVSQMPRYFYEAGLGWPETVLHMLVSSGPDGFGPAYAVRTLRSLAPLLERSGVVTARELDLDTLEARLRKACANGAPSLYGVNGGAWVRLR